MKRKSCEISTLRRSLKALILGLLFLTISINISPIFCTANEDSIYQSNNLSRNISDSNLDFFLNKDLYNNVLERITVFANCGSRVTGYAGNYIAAQYIIDEFSKLGLNVTIQKFNVTVPIDFGSNVTVISPIERVLKGYAVWPNGIQTSPVDSLEGTLIYVKGTSPEDFDQKTVKDSIVLMEFNSDSNWLYGADLGAKAFIFIEPSDSSISESMKKFVEAPIFFPRLLVKSEDGEMLKRLVLDDQSEVRVKISLRMEWRTVETQNIIAMINGTGNPEDVIVLASHYDSWSVVPAISCNAHDATGVSWLIELARYFSINRPVRSVMFVALSAHWQALAGEREFIDDFYFSNQVQTGAIKPWIFVGLGPFSSDSSKIQLLYTSFYAGVGSTSTNVPNRFSWLLRRITQTYLFDPALRSVSQNLISVDFDPSLLVEERLSTTSMWWGTIQQPIMLESEIPLSTGAIAFNILSSPVVTYHKFIGTTVNDLNLINMENLKPQFLLSGFIISSILNDNEWSIVWNDVKPSRSRYEGSSLIPSQNAGYITLEGKILSFNNSKGWYEAFPNALVQVQGTSINNPLAKIITFADTDGNFIVKGITPYTLTYQKSAWKITAWGIDQKSGNILYAPDLGIQGSGVFSNIVYPLSSPTKVSVVVAELRAITVFDLLDPRYFRQLVILDPRFNTIVAGEMFVSTNGFLIPLEFESKSNFLTYGSYYDLWETVGVVFVPPFSKSTFLFKIGGSGSSSLSWSIFISNSTDNAPEGQGISVSNSSIVIPFSIYCMASDIYRATQSRYEQIMAYNVRSLSVEHALSEAQKNLALVEELYTNKSFSEAYGRAALAYAYVARAYNEVMAIINESGTSITTLFILAIIVSFALERVVVQAEKGLVRICYMAGFAVLSIIAMSLIHPAYTVMSNAVIANIGSILLIMFVISLVILFIEAEKMSKALSVKFLGKHSIEKARLGVVALASSVSTNFMRRYKLRSSLTFLTVFIVSASITSVVCMAPYVGVKISSKPVGAAQLMYKSQIFMQTSHGLPPDISSSETITILRQILKDSYKVLPRVVYFPQTYYGNGVYQEVSSENKSIYVRCILGVSSNEGVLQEVLTSGWFFTEFAKWSCILSTQQARALNATIGDVVRTGGYELTIVGIYDELLLSQFSEPNGLAFGIPDPSYNSQLAKDMVRPIDPGVPIPNLPWDLVLIVPEEFAISLGGAVHSIVILPLSPETSESVIQATSSEMAFVLDQNIAVAFGDSVSSVSRLLLYIVFGLESLVVLVVIATLNIMVTILSTIRERTKEIHVFAVTGLTPLGSMSIFILESVIYAIIGSFLGYFAGFGLNAVFRGAGLLPKEIPFNHISSTTMLTIVVIVSASFIMSLWPSFSASKSVTPSLLRKWEFTTKPHHDEWQIPIPSRASSKNEAVGILRFLKEYFDGAGAEGHMFIINKTNEVSVEDATLTLTIRQAPYELFIMSDVKIQFVQDTEGYSTLVYLKKTSGDRKAWIVSSYYFVDSLRKQLLLWRSLAVEDRRRFIDG